MTLKSVLILVFMAGAVAAPAQEKENSELAGTEACTVCHDAHMSDKRYLLK